MEKTKAFQRTKFLPETLTQALDRLRTSPNLEHKEAWPFSGARRVTLSTGESWKHDNDEEFFADYRRAEADYAHFYFMGQEHSLSVHMDQYGTKVSVEAPDRPLIELIFEIFETAAPAARLLDPPDPPKTEPVIFIGHGRDGQWRDLKDHLHEKHGLAIQAYEIGARAGHTVRDILDEMLRESSFALLVMTGEDEDKEGKLRVRDNVIHEAGLFQGHLGWSRAIVLLELGAEEFSNIHGIQQIRFARDQIASTFGEVLATLAREFPS